MQHEIKALLNYETSSFEEKYLGLPVPEGKMKKGKFKTLKKSFQNRAYTGQRYIFRVLRKKHL
jgi:hypothetical protein